MSERIRPRIRPQHRQVLGLVTLALLGAAFASPAPASALGELSQLGIPPTACVSETGSGGLCVDGNGLNAPAGIAMSADAKSVYSTAIAGDAVSIMNRNTTTGVLTPAGCISEGGVGGCDDGSNMDVPFGVVVSPDRKNVYVTAQVSDAVSTFNRNTTTGSISQAGCVSDTGTGGCLNGSGLDAAAGIAISADGKSVYVASPGSDSVSFLTRNTTTGALTPAGCVSETGAGGCADGSGLLGAGGVVVSADRKSVYVASSDSNAVSILSRNITTGALTPAGCVSEDGSGGCADGSGLSAPTAVAISPNGKSVYAASIGGSSVSILNRNTTTGALTPAGCVSDDGSDGCADGSGLFGAFGVTVSKDAKSVYVASLGGQIATLNRNTTTGALTPAGCVSDDGLGGCADGTALLETIAIVVSPTGKSLYATGSSSNAVAEFSRSTTTGQIKQLGTPPASCISEDGTGGLCADGSALDAPFDVAVSKDAKSVYATSVLSDAVSIYKRNTTTGVLTQTGCVSETGAGGCINGSGLDGAIGVVVSADGKSVYVASQTGDAIATLNRNTTTGALTPAGCVSETGAGGCADGAGLDGVVGIAVSPNGKSVYAGAPVSDAVSILSRNTTTGVLTAAGCVSETGSGGCADGSGLDGAARLAVSPDAKSVYVASEASDAVSILARNTISGGLTPAGCVSETGAGGCADGSGLDGALAVAVSPTNKSVYVAASTGSAVSTLNRNTTTGALTPAGCISETGAGGCADGSGLGTAVDVTVSPDGKSVYVAGTTTNSVSILSRNTTTGVLSPQGCVSEPAAGGCSGAIGLTGAFGLVVSPSNKSLYVAGGGADAIAAFARKTTL